MLTDQFLVNGKPLENQAVIIREWDDSRAVGGRRATNVIVPMRNGEIWQPKSWESKSFTVGIYILGVDPDTGREPDTLEGKRAMFNTNWRRFVARVIEERALTLGRTVTLTGGRLERHEAPAEVTGDITPEMINPWTARTAVTFKLLDGLWYNEWADTIARIDGSVESGLGASADRKMAVQVEGDTTTNYIKITLARFNGEQGIRNLTTGDMVKITAQTKFDFVYLDVRNFTATQGDGSVISDLVVGDSQVSPFWMTLRPGPNRFQLIGEGRVRIQYRGAML